jgi:hypothetical protein
MTDLKRDGELDAVLATFGAELSRWPETRRSGAREALLRDQKFRRAWERERDLDRAIQTCAGELDREIAAAGALARVRERALARLPDPIAGIGWQRIAAAMLVAAMLGGAMDLVLMEETEASADVVMLDPLYGLAETAFE